ncbi:MAG: PAS domain-containing protein [Ardenticatenaceae bacterium]|nr:PAS domain-containing protein [Ardenticatenaceae bacterium]MCB9445107.1 PAS domain-containing protein [Ardenticatenaceae bacterium]
MKDIHDFLPHQTIAIVDENQSDLQLLTDILSEKGHSIRAYANSDAALADIQTNLPALIFLSVTMPQIDGFMVCRQLKTNERTASIPVVFTSTMEEIALKAKAYSVGGIDYIFKPYQVEEILTKVDTHLSLYVKQQYLETQNRLQPKELAEQEATKEQLLQEITRRKKAEHRHQEHLNFLESLDRINRAVQGTNDIQQMMSDTLDVVLSTFNCDRAFLSYPCDPETPSWEVPMERTVPEYPGFFDLGHTAIPTTPRMQNLMEALLSTNEPVAPKWGREIDPDDDPWKTFSIKSVLATALHPKIGKPWVFGLQQCSRSREWTNQERNLFQEIGRRLTDALNILLMYSDLQKSEKAVREEQERIQMIMETITVPIIISRFTDSKVLYANPALVRLSRVTQEELIGSNAQNYYVNHSDRGKVVAQLQQQGAVNDLEVQIQFGKGEQYWGLLSASLINYQNETCLLGSFTDLTDRKEAERERLEHLYFLESLDRINQAIQRTNDLQQMMSDTLDIVLSIFDCDRALLLHDPENFPWEIVKERTKPEYPGSLEQTPLAIPSIKKLTAALLKTDGVIELKLGRDIDPNKEPWKTFEIKSLLAIALHPNIGKPWQFGIHQCAINRDWTTQEKNLFQEIGRRLTDALNILLVYRDLQKSEERYREAQRIARLGHWTFDVSSRQFLWWSDESFRLLNLEPSNEPLDFQQFMALIHPDDHAHVEERLALSVNTGALFAIEIRVQLANGETRILEAHGVTHRGADQKVERLTGTVMDITERKQAENERLEHLHFLESLDQVNLAIQGTNDIQQMMFNLLEAVLTIFSCDRVNLLYACDPEAPTWDVLMERTVPEYPGAYELLDSPIPMTPPIQKLFAALLGSDGPVELKWGEELSFNDEIWQTYEVKSLLGIALYPNIDKPWALGLHQCSSSRDWTSQEKKLLHEISRRLTDALNTMLVHRDLQQSEERYREAQRIARIGHWTFDINSEQFFWWSEETFRLLNLEPGNDPPNFQEFMTYIHPDDRAYVEGTLARSISSGVPYASEHRVRWANGEIRILEAHGVVHRGVDQKVERITGTVMDVTERKQAENERLEHLYFLESLDRANLAIQGTNDLQQMMFDLLDVVLSIFSCDRAYLLYACDPEAPTWDVPMECTVPEYPGAYELLDSPIPMTPPIQKLFTSLLGVDGPVELKWGEDLNFNDEIWQTYNVKSLLGIALYPSIGKPWAFGLHQCSSSRDWTSQEKKLFHEISRRLTDALSTLLMYRDLQISEERYREAQRTARLGHWSYDVSSERFHWWSEETFRLLELDPAHGHPSYQEFLAKAHPDDRAYITEQMTHSIVTGSPFAIEYRVPLANGEMRILEARGLVHREISQGVERVTGTGTVMDVTERKQAEAEIRLLNEELEKRVLERTAQLEAANKELEAFSYSVSHDLRAPLRAVDGYTRMLVEDYEQVLGSDGQRMCTVIRNETQRMGQLIDDLLAFSRLGRAEMHVATIDMTTLVEAIFQEITTPEEQVRIDFRLDSLPAAPGDPSLIHQVWVNLLSNAVKFSAKRPLSIIEVGAKQEEREAIYFVRDNGAGFDMQYADKLFDVFQRLHSEREFPGTGAGLAIVQRIIHRHGGRIWAESEPDQGATFTFTLPLKRTAFHSSL